jgi:hypothetical protein
MSEPQPPTAKEPAKPEGIAGLFSGKDAWMKIGVILVVLSGGGNILATKEGTSTTSAEMAQAFKEIHELHSALSDMMARQKEILAHVETSPSPAQK